jgi:hypothetical protein
VLRTLIFITLRWLQKVLQPLCFNNVSTFISVKFSDSFHTYVSWTPEFPRHKRSYWLQLTTKENQKAVVGTQVMWGLTELHGKKEKVGLSPVGRLLGIGVWRTELPRVRWPSCFSSHRCYCERNRQGTRTVEFRASEKRGALPQSELARRTG